MTAARCAGKQERLTLRKKREGERKGEHQHRIVGKDSERASRAAAIYFLLNEEAALLCHKAGQSQEYCCLHVQSPLLPDVDFKTSHLLSPPRGVVAFGHKTHQLFPVLHRKIATEAENGPEMRHL